MRCPLTLWDLVELAPGSWDGIPSWSWSSHEERYLSRGRSSEILDAGQAPTRESLSSCQARPRPTAPATTLPHSSLRTLSRTPIRSRHVLCSRSAQFHDFQESQTATHLIYVSHRSPIVCACLSNYRGRRSSSNIQEYLIARSSERLKNKVRNRIGWIPERPTARVTFRVFPHHPLSLSRYPYADSEDIVENR